jgi:hypothetical protein
VAPLTIFLGRLIGPSITLIVLSMLADKPRALLTVTALAHDRPLLMVVGILGTVAGLAIVLAHQRWSGGDLPVVVTLIGWIILIRGAVLLFLSSEATIRLIEWFRFAEFFYLYLGIPLVLGLYLTIRGFMAKAGSPAV